MMNIKRIVQGLVLIPVLSTAPMLAIAQGQQIYGGQLLTEEERQAFRDRMQAAETDEERERIREDHREFVKQRAQQQGVELPNEAPVPGEGMGHRGSGTFPQREPMSQGKGAMGSGATGKGGMGAGGGKGR